jgi:hypothetical protein
MKKAPAVTPSDTPASPQKKVINAKEFVAAFRQRPDDFYLMDKFSITPKHLKKIYSALIEKELLSEYEYNQRDGKAPEVGESEYVPLSASTAVSLVENPSEALTERIRASGYSFDTRLRGAISDAIEDKTRRLRRSTGSGKQERIATDLCPKCGEPKDPASPNECRYCGVVFAKFEAEKKKGGLSVWRDD